MADRAPPLQRRASPLVVGLVLAACSGLLIAGYFVFARRDMAVLYDNMRPAEASAVIEALEAESVPYELRNGGTTILTPAEVSDATRVRLAGAELPLSGQDGFELFDASDIGLTEFAQRIKYQRALQGELTRTIMKMEGVVEARIHLSIPERSTFRNERSPPKAAVTLLTRSSVVETPETIAGIQQLVAAAIVDLAPSDVVVLNGRGAIISPSPTQRQPIAAPSTVEALILNALKGAISADAAPAIAGISNVNSTTGDPINGNRRITITTTRDLTADEQASAHAAIRAAPVPGPGEIDIVFELRSPVTAPSDVSSSRASPVPAPTPWAPAAGASAASPTPPTAPLAPDFVVIMIGLSAVGLLIVGMLIAILRRPGRLSMEDQRRFAERLRIGLETQDREAVDAAS